MANKGTYNSSFFNSFSTRLHGTAIRFGIVIGTDVEDGLRDVVFAAPTPPQPNDDGEQSAPSKDVQRLLKSEAGGVTFTAWALQHTAAVAALLPGGLQPCGYFAVVNESAAKDLAPLLAPLLQGVTEPLVLTIDTASRKLSFWQLSAGSGKPPSLRPAQLKGDRHKDALLLWAAVPLDIVVPHVQAFDQRKEMDEDDADALSSAVEEGLKEALAGCTVGVSSAPASPMLLVDTRSEALLSTAATKDCSELQVRFLHGGSALLCSPSMAVEAGQPCLRQRSRVVATALVLRRSTELRRAVELLRKALISSAVRRLHLPIEEMEGPAPPRIALPWRVLRRPAESELPIWCGEYCFPEEEASEAVERLCQLLSLQESSLEEPPEHINEQFLMQRDHQGTYDAAAGQKEAEEEAGDRGKPNRSKGSANVPVALIALALVMLVVAVLVALAYR